MRVTEPVLNILGVLVFFLVIMAKKEKQRWRLKAFTNSTPNASATRRLTNFVGEVDKTK